MQRCDGAELLRRLDWRFLLPRPDGTTPELAVLLGAEPSLIELARRIGLAANVVDSLPSGRVADVVAVLAPARADACAVALALRQGGVAYWEADRLSGEHTLTPRRLAARLAAAGLTPVHAYAIRPTPSRGELYLPLDRSEPFQWFLDDVYAPATVVQMWGERAVRIATALQSRRLGRLVPFHAAVAVRGPVDNAGATVADHACESFDRPRPESVAMITHAGDRVVLACFSAGTPTPHSIVKVPKSMAFVSRSLDEQSVAAVVRDALGPGEADAIPQPLGVLRLDGELVATVELGRPGRSIRRSSAGWGSPRADQREDLRAAALWITRLHRDHVVEPAVWDARLEHELVGGPIEEYCSLFGASPAESALFERAMIAAAEMRGRNFPTVWQHRDYTPSNISRRGSSLHVLDWEGARPGAPLLDLLLFVTLWHESVRRLRSPERQRAGVVDLFGHAVPRSPDARFVRSVVARYADDIGVEAGFVPLLAVAGSVELALRLHAQERDAGAGWTAPAGTPDARCQIETRARNRSHNRSVLAVDRLTTLPGSLLDWSAA